MSRTFSLVCHETRSRIWIGQGGSDARVLYSGEVQTMANLRLFFNAHMDKPLYFLCDDLHDEVAEYEDWSERPVSDDDEYAKVIAPIKGEHRRIAEHFTAEKPAGDPNAPPIPYDKE